MDEIILFEPFIDVSKQPQIIKDYYALLREQIIWSRFTHFDNEREIFIEHDSNMLGELSDLWYAMELYERKLADQYCEIWCYANLQWYDDYDKSHIEDYKKYKEENKILFSNDNPNPPRRVTNQEYFELRKRLINE